jgi:type IV secretory pathway protease TraF
MVLATTPTSVRQLAAARRYIPAGVPLLKRIAAQGATMSARWAATFLSTVNGPQRALPQIVKVAPCHGGAAAKCSGTAAFSC